MPDQNIKELMEQRRKHSRYSSSFKMAAIEKVLNNPLVSYSKISREIGVPMGVLWSWYNKFRNEQLILNSEPVSQVLSTQELFWVQATIGAREKDKVRYCRKYGIPYEKLLEWTELYKDERYQVTTEEVQVVNKKNHEMNEQLKQENKELRQELQNFKKRALSAEALLELKKKVDQLLKELPSDEEN